MTQQMHNACPICRRYCGPAKTCPYCGAMRTVSKLHKRLRHGAWLVAIIGLAFLLVAAHLQGPQTVPIADISPTMQFAQLYFEGSLTHAPRISRNRKSAATDLADGSGETLRIVFLDEAAMTIQELVPGLEAGSRLHVTGGLRIRAGEPPVLFIRSPEQFRLLEEE